MHPFGWKPPARQQFSAGRTIFRSSRTVVEQFQIRSGMNPFGWKPTTRQQFQCRPSDSPQQQRNSNRAVLTQIGHDHGRLEAQGQTAIQCRQNKNWQPQNSSRTVSTQIGYAPVRLETQGPTAVQCRQSDSLQQQNSSGTVPTQIGHAPVRLEAQGQTAVSVQANILRSRRGTVTGQF